MQIWRGRRCRAALASARAAGVGLVGVVALATPGLASVGDGRTDDPRDVGNRLDLKTVTHLADGSLIVHTAETYGPFSDQSAVFKWGIDRDGDESFDLIVFTEWRDGKLTGGVKDAAGQQIAPAVVSRPAPTKVSVAFPAEVLGGAAVYGYAVDSEADLDGDGPSDPGERDLAPNSGLVQHRVAPLTVGGAGNKETRAAASAPATVEAPVPAKVEAAAPATVEAAAPSTNLPRTGPDDRALLPWAGSVLMLGGGLVALGAQRKRTRKVRGSGGVPRKDRTGGIR